MSIWKKNNSKVKQIDLIIKIERRNNPNSDPYIQSIRYESQNLNATLATALAEINNNEYKDINGEPVEFIMWENSCLQRKCGACAMVIEGIPKLACRCFLKEYRKEILVTPMKKFPLIKDLVVDRDVLFENLKRLDVWLEKSEIRDGNREIIYEASKCLQCGCCLEVCPNFHLDEDFFGAAGAVAATGVISQENNNISNQILEKYSKHVYEGCGKSLACKNICPAGIDVEHMLIHSNKISLWKKRNKHTRLNQGEKN